MADVDSLVERMLAELKGGLTKRGGHLAQRVTTEYMGLCSERRGETPACRERRALIAEAERYLAERWLDRRKAV